MHMTDNCLNLFIVGRLWKPLRCPGWEQPDTTAGGVCSSTTTSSQSSIRIATQYWRSVGHRWCCCCCRRRRCYYSGKRCGWRQRSRPRLNIEFEQRRQRPISFIPCNALQGQSIRWLWILRFWWPVWAWRLHQSHSYRRPGRCHRFTKAIRSYYAGENSISYCSYTESHTATNYMQNGCHMCQSKVWTMNFANLIKQIDKKNNFLEYTCFVCLLLFVFTAISFAIMSFDCLLFFINFFSATNRSMIQKPKISIVVWQCL